MSGWSKVPGALVALLVLASAAGGAEGAMVSFVPTLEGETTVAAGQFSVLAHFSPLDGTPVAYSFEEKGGREADLILLDVNDYHAYRAGGNVSCIPGSALNATSGADVFMDLAIGQEYYLVLDNTLLPFGGATPDGQVTVSYSIGLGSAELIEDQGFEWALPLMAAGFLGLAAVVLYFMLRQRKGKGLGEPGSASLEMRNCPHCGAAMAMFDHDCPRCGKRS
ncbi:MAG: hypothetical protein MUE65_01835 [Methanomassiliicoccales archaeon]|jgi:hypothetical protein|nr:hypothetical protein [Methanomassiliicoccales archaeon]